MLENHIQLFYNMLLECYNVCGWKYDPQLCIQFTNSVSPNLHKLLFLGLGREQAILEHAGKSDVPMIISDDLGLTWGIVEQKNGHPENIGDFYVLGPVVNKEFTTQMMESMVVPYNLSMQNKWYLIEALKRIPIQPTVVFFQQIITLHYYVNNTKIRISDFAYYTPRQEERAENKEEIREEVPHATPLTEKKLLDMVRTGNLEYHTALAEAGAVSPGIRVKSADPIQQAKYSVVAFITLCTRAAIEGGLSSEMAYTLSDTYTQSVDMAQSFSQVAAVSHTMYDDFIRRVNQVRRESGISRPVRICCDYIDTHPEKELTLHLLAEKVGYTENYLARKFKAEMGIPINSYVRKARIHRAKMLLSATAMSIQEIADHLHFCSGSYFAEAFRKETGVSPAIFREHFLKDSR